MPIRNVSDAMHEMREGSAHIKSRKQAIAVGLSAQRRLQKRGSYNRRHSSKSISSRRS